GGAEGPGGGGDAVIVGGGDRGVDGAAPRVRGESDVRADHGVPEGVLDLELERQREGGACGALLPVPASRGEGRGRTGNGGCGNDHRLVRSTHAGSEVLRPGDGAELPGRGGDARFVGDGVGRVDEAALVVGGEGDRHAGDRVAEGVGDDE